MRQASRLLQVLAEQEFQAVFLLLRFLPLAASVQSVQFVPALFLLLLLQGLLHTSKGCRMLPDCRLHSQRQSFRFCLFGEYVFLLQILSLRHNSKSFQLLFCRRTFCRLSLRQSDRNRSLYSGRILPLKSCLLFFRYILFAVQ